jgi:L-ornithine Nalpha-acyltransferase
MLRTIHALMGSRSYSSCDPRLVSLAQNGRFSVRIIRTSRELRRAQRLRYGAFYRELPGTPSIVARLTRRDVDSFDSICDHLIVLQNGQSEVLGTYRILRQELAEHYGGFSTAEKFDINNLLARHTDINFAEVGRSCVLPSLRKKGIIGLLWTGVYHYALAHNIGAMFGTAALVGTDIKNLERELSFLHHYAGAPEVWRARALPKVYVNMDRIPKTLIDTKAVFRRLPPLVKGYLRLGAYVGDGAVVDRKFGVTFVFFVLPMFRVDARYLMHFDRAVSTISVGECVA